jgi:D-alanyl-D-alanine carboxypeptidase (penicillin-binding protein 5/6)
MLADYDLTHSRYFARIVGLPGAVLRTGPAGYVVNSNDLVGRVPWIDGVKTGHTADAGYVLVASGHRNGMTLISAVLGTDSDQERDDNTLALLDYGFGDFRLETPVRSGEVLARPTVRDQPGVRAPLVAAVTFTNVLARDVPVHVAVQAPRQLTGPLPARAVLGTAVVLAGQRAIARIPLLLTRALPRVSGLTIVARFMTKPLTLVIVGLALVLLLGIRVAQPRLARRRRRPGASRAEPDAT